MQPGTMTPALEEETQVESFGDDPVESALWYALWFAQQYQITYPNGLLAWQARALEKQAEAASTYYDKLNWWGIGGFFLALALGFVAGRW